MIDFFMGGGFSMFVVLLFGALTLAVAIRFFAKPDKGQMSTIRALTVATLFAVLCGFTSNMAAVMTKVPGTPEWAQSPQVHLIVMTGIGESLAPAILGFALLALAWAAAAFGVRKLDRAELA